MTLYLATLGGARRRFGWKVRFSWNPDRQITDLDRRTLRRLYRQMRTAGLTELDARWVLWDAIDLGTRATRHDGRPAAS